MSRLQFIILLVLSVIVSLGAFLQLYLVHAAAGDENRLRNTAAALQEGQLDYNRLQQVANWTARLGEQKNDQTLRDVLTKNNIQVKANPPASGSSVPATTTPTTPAAH